MNKCHQHLHFNKRKKTNLENCHCCSSGVGGFEGSEGVRASSTSTAV